MPDTYQGMRRYVDAAARELGVEDTGPFLPVGLATRSRPLQLIESQIAGAIRAPDGADRGAVLGHCEDLLRSIGLEYRAAQKMLAHAHAVLGLEAPAYLGRPLSPPESETTDARPESGTGPEPRRAADAGRHRRGA